MGRGIMFSFKDIRGLSGQDWVEGVLLQGSGMSVRCINGGEQVTQWNDSIGKLSWNYMDSVSGNIKILFSSAKKNGIYHINIPDTTCDLSS